MYHTAADRGEPAPSPNRAYGWRACGIVAVAGDRDHEGARWNAESLRIHVDRDIEVGGAIDRATDCRPGATPGLLLAHGANNRFDHPLLTTVARHLAERGTATVLRFNFPYAERGASSPDPQHRLETAFRRAHDALLDEMVCPPGPLFMGGKSLGARIAAELVSRHHEGEGLLASGLVFLGYPLHAPGRKDRLRTEALRRIEVPSLFVCGTRDPFCDLDLLLPVIERLDIPGTLMVIDGGNHSLEPPAADPRTKEDTRLLAAQAVEQFIREHRG